MLREALAATISALPAPTRADRAELLELLQRDGILHRSATQPILSRDGSSARWMLNSLAVTLTARGGLLAGRCLGELLKRFDSRQLATYGLTGVPILQSCVAGSGGRYRGLLIRKERKPHGSLKLIEGPLDPNESIILVDDSVSSGTCMIEACALAEQAGLRVEGAVFLVRFGWYGGYALMQERGYHVEALYDIWDDFISHMADEEQPLANPSKWWPSFKWSSAQAPSGLHPARLARLAITEYVSSGQLLRPPVTLDSDYESAGGTWVSIRAREDLYRRHARDGFWHFPGEGSRSTPEDVVLASLRTALALPSGGDGLKIIDASDIAVTFFSTLEKCSVGQLDNDRYGIVVRSIERQSLMGGALPRMPGIANEWEQFQHARRKNGQLISFEPFEIFRHRVSKTVESGVNWPSSGVPAGPETPWHEDQGIGGRIAERARDIVLGVWFDDPPSSSPLSDDLVPAALHSIYVTVYLNGQVRGCMGFAVRALDDNLRTLALAAAGDERFDARVPADAGSVAVSVSLLFDPLELGEATAEDIAPYFRIGSQALMAYRGDRVGLLLPSVAATHNLDRVAFAQAVVDKIGSAEASHFWCRFDCVTWLADADRTVQCPGGFPHVDPDYSDTRELLGHHAALHAQYILQHQREDGRFYSDYEPFQNRLYEETSLPRLAHAAWVMARGQSLLANSALRLGAGRTVDLLADATRRIEGALWIEDGQVSSVSEVSFLLLALCQLREGSPHYRLCGELAATLWSAVQLPHGRVMTHRQPAEADQAFQDYLPGQVLLALAVAADGGTTTVDEDRLYRSFSYYRHRFRYQRHFGQVSWLMQAFAQWWWLTRDPQFSDLVFEVGDWILGYQQEKTGGFINDHQPETPGYTTALYLEGVCAALRVAAAVNDPVRHERYARAVSRGFAFLDRLILQPRDASLLPNPELCFGGLRESVNRSHVRIDFVQHSLSAILEYMSLADATRLPRD